MATFGPRLTARDRTRLRVGAGKGRRVRVSPGTYVELDTDPVLLAVADGLGVAARRILEIATANAPDDPTTPGSRIREAGTFGVYAFGSIMHVEGAPRDFRKPRSFRPDRDGVSAVVKFGSRLHHLHELGTVNMPARPYLGPARVAVAPEVPGIIRANFPKDGP